MSKNQSTSQTYQSFKKKYLKHVIAWAEKNDTHGTVFVGGPNIALNIYKPIPKVLLQMSYWKTVENSFIEMVKTLAEVQGSDFYLNEAPHGDNDTCLFIDIDFNMPQNALENILDAIGDLCVEPPKFRVLRNSESGKIHIATNINVYDRKATLKYLKEYLWYSISWLNVMTRKQWDTAFDTAATGLRSAFSVKFDKSRDDPKVFSRARYVPVSAETGEPIHQFEDGSMPKPDELAKILWEYSIYNTPVRVTLAEEIEDEIEASREEAVAIPDELVGGKIQVDGKEVPVDTKFINTAIKCIGKYMGVGRRWFVTCLNVRYASAAVKEYDPNWFLNEWSLEASPAEYNANGNTIIWYNIKIHPEKIGPAVTWLRDMALKGDRLEFMRELGLRTGFFDPANDKFFGDYLKICRKYKDWQEYDQIAGEFVRSTVAHVVNGGKRIYITRNRGEGGSVKCAILKRANIRDIDESIKVGDDTSISFLGFITRHHREITYDKVVFAPTPLGEMPACEPGGDFNMFTGFAVTPKDTGNDISPILEHVRKVLAGGNNAVYEYILDWLAHIVQKPREKMGTALLFKSRQGAGKNIFWEWVARSIIGEYGKVCNDIEQITGKFNAMIENAILTICDEIQNYGGAFKSNDKLKSLITQTKLVLERKGIDALELDDYNNYVFLTNNDWPIKVESSDRRYVCCECSDEFRGNSAYFGRLRACMKEGVEAFAWFLVNRDLSNFDPRKIPLTDLKVELKINSISPVYTWLASVIRGEDNNVNTTVGGEEPLFAKVSYLSQYFHQWCRQSNIPPTTDRTFQLQLAKVVKTEVRRVDGACTRVVRMDREALKRALCAHLELTLDQFDLI